MTLSQIELVSIPVSDQERAKIFYRDCLGFELMVETDQPPLEKWIQLRPPGAATSISLVTWFEGMNPGTMRGLILQTDDIEAERERLMGHKVDVGPIQAMPWGKFAAFADPDGNKWSLHQP